MRNLRLVLLAGLLVPGSATARADEPPAFGVKCQRAGDKVTVAKEEQRVVFTVSSPRGIGGATITRQDAAWPAEMVLRLKLSGLESLTINNGALKLEAAVQSHGGFGRSVHSSKPGGEPQPVDAGCLRAFTADGKPTDKLPGPGGWFELVVPRALLGDDVKKLEITWIDFYR